MSATARQTLSHLDALEAEAMHIMREVAAEREGRWAGTERTECGLHSGSVGGAA